ncbi:hypothetical protein [Nocardioides sp. CER19]|uniref:hypothetical protein n=1 Tax=Nocardioides sp. CER19 TaxID=3038538 RepID=UPI002449DFF3|nr:hypothetical protein [Nocardioides sp. CER19]MDH2415272.1 hypothetical protein [Nocardioides sp. CER19]
MTTSASLQALAHALDRLAWAASEQTEYLSALGVADLTDELALEFDDIYRPHASQLEAISPESAATCQDLQSLLSSDKLGWTFADLQSPEWDRVRTLAAAASDALARDAAGDLRRDGPRPGSAS